MQRNEKYIESKAWWIMLIHNTSPLRQVFVYETDSICIKVSFIFIPASHWSTCNRNSRSFSSCRLSSAALSKWTPLGRWNHYQHQRCYGWPWFSQVYQGHPEPKKYSEILENISRKTSLGLKKFGSTLVQLIAADRSCTSSACEHLSGAKHQN